MALNSQKISKLVNSNSCSRSRNEYTVEYDFGVIVQQMKKFRSINANVLIQGRKFSNHSFFRLSTDEKYISKDMSDQDANIRVDKMLPHRQDKIVAYTADTPIHKVPVSIPRLEQHYFNTIADDLLVLTYDHMSKDRDAVLSAELPSDHMKQLFSLPLEELPTEPYSELGACTNLITKDNCRQIKKQKPVYQKGNPIDYARIPKQLQLMNRTTQVVNNDSFKPCYSWIPVLKRLELRIISDAAITNKNVLYSALMTLTQITGVKANPLYAERAELQKKIREGMPIGALVVLREAKMYEFIDKLVHTVLPRLREWKGLKPRPAAHGSLELRLKPSETSHFPDIEPHFDMYPKTFETEIAFITNTVPENDALLLSGLGFPIDDAHVIEELVEKKDDDPWARFKKDAGGAMLESGPIRGTTVRRKT